MTEGKCFYFPRSELQWISHGALQEFLSFAKSERQWDEKTIFDKLDCYETPDGDLILSLRSVGGSTVFVVAMGRWGRIGHLDLRPSDAMSVDEREVDAAAAATDDVRQTEERKVYRAQPRNISPREDIRLLNKRLDAIMAALPIFRDHERQILHTAMRTLWASGRTITEADIDLDSQAKHDFICAACERTEFLQEQVWPRAELRLSGPAGHRILLLAVPCELGAIADGLYIYLVPASGWTYRQLIAVHPDAEADAPDASPDAT